MACIGVKLSERSSEAVRWLAALGDDFGVSLRQMRVGGLSAWPSLPADAIWPSISNNFCAARWSAPSARRLSQGAGICRT
jgi:hypothetical protein